MFDGIISSIFWTFLRIRDVLVQCIIDRLNITFVIKDNNYICKE